MGVLLQINDAHKSYGDQVLFDNADVTLNDNVKVGFVGRNGCGKSTLLKVLLGEEELESGEVVRSRGLRLGYLRQHDPFLPKETALDFLLRDSGQPDWKCGEVAGQFELKGAYLNGPVSELSGGWQTRVKLAALLLHDPNLLMLDEPTNFLDLRTQLLLEQFLRNFTEACLIVSHDRSFLAATCTHTLDLSHGKLTMFPGKIDAYLDYVHERREHDERANVAVAAKQRELQKFIDKNKTRASTANRAKSKSKQLERLQLTTIASDEPTANIRMPIVEPRQGPAVRCLDLTIGYPGHVVADDINLEIEHGDRAAIVGDNGEGKTTLLRTMVDSLPSLHGEVRWGFGCEIGVYAQHVYTSLPERQTVLEYLDYNSIPGTTAEQILRQAGALLFRGRHVKKRISVLSGGERARLCLAGLLLGSYNVLILDEPGNHLDVETVEALAEALETYKGTVLFTSHDRHFMKRVATSVIEVRDHHVRNYGGDYDAYLYAVNKEVNEGDRDLQTRTKTPSAKLLSKETRRSEKRDERKIRKEVASVERVIGRLDKEKQAINKQLLATSDQAEALRLHNEITALTTKLTELEERWCQLQEDIEIAEQRV